jgi:hypothetical protein
MSARYQHMHLLIRNGEGLPDLDTKASTSEDSETGWSRPGIVGTPHSIASFLADILFPKLSSTLAGGPMTMWQVVSQSSSGGVLNTNVSEILYI